MLSRNNRRVIIHEGTTLIPFSLLEVKASFNTLLSPSVGLQYIKESQRKIEYIQKQFITHNLKINANTLYPSLTEASIHPIESMNMIRYLIYKKKLYNMDDKNFPKIASNSSQNHHLLLLRMA